MQNITSLIIHRGRSVQANSVKRRFSKKVDRQAVSAVRGCFTIIANGWRREVVNSRRGIFATCRVICSPFGIGFFDPSSLFVRLFDCAVCISNRSSPALARVFFSRVLLFTCSLAPIQIGILDDHCTND